MKTICIALIFSTLAAKALADAQLTSWLTANSGQYARVYKTTSDRTAGTTYTTWTGQASPSYADIAEVSYSSSWVYVKATGLASHTMGPWLNPMGGQFMFWPTNQHGIYKFSRTPSAATGNKTTTGAGYSGLFVNGVAIFNFTDGKAWDGSGTVNGPHNQLTYYWHRNASVGEAFNFDYALGHQPPTAIYHSHQQSLGVRYQLGDHVDYNSSTKNYSESAGVVTKHSPIVGWSYDGYPIYGPYGYSVTNNANSGVRRMISGYVQRDGSNGTDVLSNNLTTLPAWYARFRQKLGASYSTTAATARPATTGTNLLGTYAEDFSYLGDLINSATGKNYVQATNTFDLDQYNGRWCVTPEFPGGTYAYFLSVDSGGTSVYPFVFGYEYYGNVTGGAVSSIGEVVTTNFTGAASATLTMASPAITNNVVTLTWSATEGGTYRVEATGNLTTWTTNTSGIAAVLNKGTCTTSKVSTNQFFRVTRTALASYDAN